MMTNSKKSKIMNEFHSFHHRHVGQTERFTQVILFNLFLCAYFFTFLFLFCVQLFSSPSSSSSFSFDQGSHDVLTRKKDEICVLLIVNEHLCVCLCVCDSLVQIDFHLVVSSSSCPFFLAVVNYLSIYLFV